MHTQFAAWIDQPVDHQQLQHFLPTDCFPAVRQSFLPEIIESQLAPQIARQPAVAERTGSPKLQLAQLHLQTVYRISGNLPIFWKQTQRPRTLSLFVKYVQTLPPCTFLLIVDLTEIQHRPLCCLARRQAAILNDAEVPDAPSHPSFGLCFAKTSKQQNDTSRLKAKVGRSSPQPFSRTRVA